MGSHAHESTWLATAQSTDNEPEPDDEHAAPSADDGPAPTPQHPIPTMQGAFEESMRETLDDAEAEADTRLAKADSKARRKQLLEEARYERRVAGKWRQKPGERFHPLWKLVAQISFGMHLLHRGLARSDDEVIAILQTHVDEVDGFLERTTADFDLARADVRDRARYLQLPLEHADVFDAMLRDRGFRAAMVEGMEKIEHIIERTAAALRDALKDVRKGLDGARELARYLRRLERAGPPDRAGDGGDDAAAAAAARRPAVADVFAAMAGNTEGWATAFLGLEAKGDRLDASLHKLARIIAEIQRRVGVASRKDLPTRHPPRASSSASSTAAATSSARAPQIGLFNSAAPTPRGIGSPVPQSPGLPPPRSPNLLAPDAGPRARSPLASPNHEAAPERPAAAPVAAASSAAAAAAKKRASPRGLTGLAPPLDAAGPIVEESEPESSDANAASPVRERTRGFFALERSPVQRTPSPRIALSAPHDDLPKGAISPAAEEARQPSPRVSPDAFGLTRSSTSGGSSPAPVAKKLSLSDKARSLGKNIALDPPATPGPASSGSAADGARDLPRSATQPPAQPWTPTPGSGGAPAEAPRPHSAGHSAAGATHSAQDRSAVGGSGGVSGGGGGAGPGQPASAGKRFPSPYDLEYLLRVTPSDASGSAHRSPELPLSARSGGRPALAVAVEAPREGRVKSMTGELQRLDELLAEEDLAEEEEEEEREEEGKARGLGSVEESPEEHLDVKPEAEARGAVERKDERSEPGGSDSTKIETNPGPDRDIRGDSPDRKLSTEIGPLPSIPVQGDDLREAMENAAHLELGLDQEIEEQLKAQSPASEDESDDDEAGDGVAGGSAADGRLAPANTDVREGRAVRLASVTSAGSARPQVRELTLRNTRSSESLPRPAGAPPKRASSLYAPAAAGGAVPAVPALPSALSPGSPPPDAAAGALTPLLDTAVPRNEEPASTPFEASVQVPLPLQALAVEDIGTPMSESSAKPAALSIQKQPSPKAEQGPVQLERQHSQSGRGVTDTSDDAEKDEPGATDHSSTKDVVLPVSEAIPANAPQLKLSLSSTQSDLAPPTEASSPRDTPTPSSDGGSMRGPSPEKEVLAAPSVPEPAPAPQPETQPEPEPESPPLAALTSATVTGPEPDYPFSLAMSIPSVASSAAVSRRHSPQPPERSSLRPPPPGASELESPYPATGRRQPGSTSPPPPADAGPAALPPPPQSPLRRPTPNADGPLGPSPFAPPTTASPYPPPPATHTVSPPRRPTAYARTGSAHGPAPGRPPPNLKLFPPPDERKTPSRNASTSAGTGSPPRTASPADGGGLGGHVALGHYLESGKPRSPWRKVFGPLASAAGSRHRRGRSGGGSGGELQSPAADERGPGGARAGLAKVFGRAKAEPPPPEKARPFTDETAAAGATEPSDGDGQDRFRYM